MQLLGLRRQFLGGRGDLFRRRGVLLRHLIELLDRLVDLRGADVLLAASGGDLADEFRRAPDVRHQANQHRARLLRRLHRVGRKRADLGGGRLAALGELADLGGDNREATAVFAGARRLDGRVERKEIGLASDLLHDRDLLGDRLHRVHGAGDGGAARFRVLRRLARDLFRLARVVGALFDVRRHLLHRGRGLFGGRSLLGRALRQLFGARRKLLAAGRDVLGRRDRFAHDALELHSHRVQRFDEVPNFVVARRFRFAREVAAGDRAGQIDRASLTAADIKGDKDRRSERDQQGDGGRPDKKRLSLARRPAPLGPPHRPSIF